MYRVARAHRGLWDDEVQLHRIPTLRDRIRLSGKRVLKIGPLDNPIVLRLEADVTYGRALPPIPADNAALGVIPTAAFKYCEAVRRASAFGWYIFPPFDVRLRWDGAEICWFNDAEERWMPFISVPIPDPEWLDHWNEYAPQDLRDGSPPFLTTLPVPGIVQIWSGLLIGTAEGWSTLVRPVVNHPQTVGWQSYEGLVETDTFRPCPLFANIRLVATHRNIFLARDRPLFQVQPISRVAYTQETLTPRFYDGIRPRLDVSLADWEGYRKTTRSSDPAGDDHRPGKYGANVALPACGGAPSNFAGMARSSGGRQK